MRNVSGKAVQTPALAQNPNRVVAPHRRSLWLKGSLYVLAVALWTYAPPTSLLHRRPI